MGSSMIHLAIGQEMRKEVSFRDINRLFLGVILPDGTVAGNSHLKKKICVKVTQLLLEHSIYTKLVA